MHKIILLASAIAFVLTSYASENDTIPSSVSLQEVVVEAPKIVRKADMDVLYPSASAIWLQKLEGRLPAYITRAGWKPALLGLKIIII